MQKIRYILLGNKAGAREHKTACILLFLLLLFRDSFISFAYLPRLLKICLYAVDLY